jgi:hypothetical protein
MAIQIGKYKRPGIFIEEFDKSIIATPQSVDQLTNLVLGVSKKGPVNTPIKVSTLNEFESIFGEIDRNLERRGSFFHRTVEKMLESSPVYAMNLLMTNDNLDRVQYQSLSTSSDIANDSKRLGAFRRFHDTTGFWKKDTESFINLTKINSGFSTRALNITNLSDKPVSVFIYKSRVNNFDVTAESWYGTDKVPGFISPKDFISDYMVDVVVVAGDWSDYKSLSQDKVWSNYFFYDEKLGSGIRKNLILNFIQNRNVKLLGYYEGLSLIPYFRDGNNKNLFIETNLNKDTDKTGVFCSFNIDLVETDGLNNIIDLVGHSIASKNETSINFLSYQASIFEEKEFGVKPLDLPGNVNANLGGLTSSNKYLSSASTTKSNVITNRDLLTNPFSYKDVFNNLSDHFYTATGGAPTYSGVQTNYAARTSWFNESSYWGIRYTGYKFDDSSKNTPVPAVNYHEIYFTKATKFTITYDVHVNSYFVINGEHKEIVLNSLPTANFKNQQFDISASDFPALSPTQSAIAVVYYEAKSSELKVKTGVKSSTGDGITGLTPNDVVLNTFKFKLKKDSNNINRFVPFSAWNTSFDVNGIRIDNRYSPVYTGEYYGVSNTVSQGVWNILTSNNVFSSSFGGHFLNDGGTADSIINAEDIHVDTSFVPLNGNLYPNPMIHDNSSFIESFYKKNSITDTKKYLLDDVEAEINDVAGFNIRFTGGNSNLPGANKIGYSYDARMFSYSNIDRWNYADLVPVFATNSTGSGNSTSVEAGRCTFWFDKTSDQLFALKDLSRTASSVPGSGGGTNWNPAISQLKRGDVVVPYSLDPATNKIVVNETGVNAKNVFNYKTVASHEANALIVDRVEGNRIYFFNSDVSRSLFGGLSIFNSTTDVEYRSLLSSSTPFAATVDFNPATPPTIGAKTGLASIVGTGVADLTNLVVKYSTAVTTPVNSPADSDSGIRATVSFTGGVPSLANAVITITSFPKSFSRNIANNTSFYIDKSNFTTAVTGITTNASANLTFPITDATTKIGTQLESPASFIATGDPVANVPTEGTLSGLLNLVAGATLEIPNVEVRYTSTDGTSLANSDSGIRVTIKATGAVSGTTNINIQFDYIPKFFTRTITALTSFYISRTVFAGVAAVTAQPTSNLTFVISNALTSINTQLMPSRYTLEKLNHDLFDYRVSYEGDGKIKYTFLKTDGTPNPNNYRSYRRFRLFDRLVKLLNSTDVNKRVMLLEPSTNSIGTEKVSMDGMFISDIINSSSQDRSFILNTNLPNSEIVKKRWEKVLQGFLCIYSVDDEVILGTDGMDTRMIGLTASVTSTDPLVDSIGVVSKYSDLYQEYYSGHITNGDYFQNNRTPSEVWKSTEGYSFTFFDGETEKEITELNTGKTSLFAGYNYIMFTASFDNNATTKNNDPKFQFGDMITIKQSVLNRKRITIISDNLVSSAPGSSEYFTDANGNVLDSASTSAPFVTRKDNGTQRMYIYKVAEEVVYEKLTGVKYLLDHMPSSGFNFLNMFIDNKVEANGNVVNDSLSIRFKDSYSLQSPMPSLGSVYSTNMDSLNKFYLISQSSNYKQTLEIELLPTGVTDTELVDSNGDWIADNKVLVKADRYSELRIGDFLLGVNNRLTRVIDKRIYKNDPTLVVVSCIAPIKRNPFGSKSSGNVLDLQTFLYKSVDNYTYAYKALTFNGFKTRTASLPDGTEQTQENILNIVAKGTPLYRALTNKEAIDYRYLVDSFGLGLGERSKQQLADICGSRKDIFGFLNMPSVKSFKASSSPTFVDSNGDLVVEFIAKGSNPDKASAFTYTFADGEGSTCVGYFTPYIQVDDSGRQLSMPPAAHVATTYMRKHISNLGGITPWTIAAGVTNGRITNIIGLEHNYSNDDIEWLNQAQMNPIVFKRNRGNVIETENTAQTLYKSALSFIHVREVLIELERELSRMLLDFQWQYNTPDIRAEIKLRADVICETYVSKNGLYNYFNKMDDENNTLEIIDNQIGVLDTYVEPIKGMGIIVNNVTILRTGAIDAGGFM